MVGSIHRTRVSTKHEPSPTPTPHRGARAVEVCAERPPLDGSIYPYTSCEKIQVGPHQPIDTSTY